MSYWSADENMIQVGEEKVSIPAEFGNSYVVADTSRKVSFDVPNSIQFFSGKDSYLQFDATINAPAALGTRLQLDQAGAGMLVQNLRIYDSSRGRLIEEINDYNQIVAMISDYDTDESKRGVRSLEEGGTIYTARCSGQFGNTKSQMADIHTNPWFKEADDDTKGNGANPPVPSYDNTTQQNTVRCCVPIHSGVFSGKVYPNMLTGMYIEIDLIRAPSVVRQLDSVVSQRRRTLNPVIVAAGPLAGPANTLPWAAADASDVTQIWLEKSNNYDAVEDCPFVVGELIGFQSQVTGNAPVALLTTAGGAAIDGARITKIDLNNKGDGVNRIRLTIDDGAGGAVRRGAVTDITAPGVGRFSVISVSVSKATAANARVSYTVDNLNLIIHEMKMDQAYVNTLLSSARDNGSVSFDIHSVTNHKQAITATERQAAVQIFANNSRAKSIIVVPADSSVYSNQAMISSSSTYVETEDDADIILRSARPGVSGVCDGLSQYQWQIDNKLVPSRPVDTIKTGSKQSISAFHIYELEKALSNAGIAPRSFREFQRNFLISRALGVNNGVHDLRNKDITLLLQYAHPNVEPTVGKIFSSFVFHIRRLTIRDGGVEVTH
tara:strand:- start:46 stop:1866 length:1821 start_codon:yes stop_codon:yes gene_type:complete